MLKKLCSKIVLLVCKIDVRVFFVNSWFKLGIP